MSDVSASRFHEHAKLFGCPPLVQLTSEPTAKHLEYLNLVPGWNDIKLLPDAVAEYQGRAVMYLVDGGLGVDRPETTDRELIHDLQRLLANRSEQACLGIMRPGSLDVYPINLDRKTLAETAPVIVLTTATQAPTFFQSLATGVYPVKGQPKEADFVFHEIHNLLKRASEDLRGRMDPLEVLSVAGRALFFRFLLDRKIVKKTELTEICKTASDIYDVFSNADNAAATSCWLDETFNGDLLPLVPDLKHDASPQTRYNAYLRFYRQAGKDTNESVFLHLQAILRGWKSLGKSAFQLRLPHIDWSDFDFAHIPIGVLSQVYETFSRQWDEDNAEATSVYYTPKSIAHMLVEEAFAGLSNPATARVLDPACGAGIFLVLAFRRLVRARWEVDGERPTTKTIQTILWNQICGFDVSKSALRLAALALYITSIEVNGTTRPPKSLKFPRALKGTVLHDFGHDGPSRPKGFVLGSLSPTISEKYDGAFDIVLGNPPWSRLRSIQGEDDADATQEKERIRREKLRLDELNRSFTAITRRVLTARGLRHLTRNYTNPDNNPDLPFIWRAAEWAKPDVGIIAMTLSARILFKGTPQGIAARAALLQGLTVTGIINCSNLTETAVWREMKQPFMLFFARNRASNPATSFRFSTPFRERSVNDRGFFRVDYHAAERVPVRGVLDNPWLLKALAVGTASDVGVLSRLSNLKWKSVGDYWRSPKTGLGYNLSPKQPQNPDTFLADYPDFRSPEHGFEAARHGLDSFKVRNGQETAHMPRTKDLYEPPLLIVREAPGYSREEPKSFVIREKMAFSSSYYGYSASGASQADILIGLLYLITHSLLFNYSCLIKSSKFGAERRAIQKRDLDDFPFPNVSDLSCAQKRRILRLSALLEKKQKHSWDRIDNFIFALYDLDSDCAQVVRDTLEMGVPYQEARGPAERPINEGEAVAFRTVLERALQPWFDIVGQQIDVKTLSAITQEEKWGPPPWVFLTLLATGDAAPISATFLQALMEQANWAAASRVVMHLPEGGLLVGLLNQRRFWTRSRARLCALHITRSHMDAFPIKERS